MVSRRLTGSGCGSFLTFQLHSLARRVCLARLRTCQAVTAENQKEMGHECNQQSERMGRKFREMRGEGAKKQEDDIETGAERFISIRALYFLTCCVCVLVLAALREMRCGRDRVNY